MIKSLEVVIETYKERGGDLVALTNEVESIFNQLEKLEVNKFGKENDVATEKKEDKRTADEQLSLL